MTTSQPLAVIAAGGTGGHMFPAQALAEEFLARGWRVELSTDARGARYTGGFPDAVKIEVMSSATFARGGALAKLAVPFRILGGVATAMASFRRDRPSVVVGFGGYPAIPAVAAAWAMKLPRMIHEQNGVLGRVNQLFARRVDRVACGTWPTELPDGVEGIHVGNPVRQVVRNVAGSPYTPPGDWPMSIALIGGSQAARILADRVPPAMAALPQDLKSRVRITHQARPEDEARVTEAYAAAGITAEVTGFVDVPRKFSDAQLVIARSGASTVADLTVIGRPAIFVPLKAAIRDEQTANALPLVEAGAAMIITEDDLDPAYLSEQIAAILTDPDRAMAMSRASLALGRPDAAQTLADLVEDLVASRQKGT